MLIHFRGHLNIVILLSEWRLCFERIHVATYLHSKCWRYQSTEHILTSGLPKSETTPTNIQTFPKQHISIMQSSAKARPLSPHSQSSFALYRLSNLIKQMQKTSNHVRNIIKTHVHILFLGCH